jgi:hypothetical protein
MPVPPEAYPKNWFWLIRDLGKRLMLLHQAFAFVSKYPKLLIK